ncbi:MAG: hypothetical protein R3E65_09235 [Steroidobacteraceae bacterium]
MNGAAHEFRAGLEFDVAALEAHLAAALPQFAGPLTVRQFAGGQSNPTYQLVTPQARYRAAAQATVRCCRRRMRSSGSIA